MQIMSQFEDQKCQGWKSDDSSNCKHRWDSKGFNEGHYLFLRPFKHIGPFQLQQIIRFKVNLVHRKKVSQKQLVYNPSNYIDGGHFILTKLKAYDMENIKSSSDEITWLELHKCTLTLYNKWHSSKGKSIKQWNNYNINNGSLDTLPVTDFPTLSR